MKTTLLRIVAVLSLAFVTSSMAAQLGEPINLWPDGAPGEVLDVEESLKPDEGDNVIRITNVTVPTITIYKPAPNLDNGAAVIISPGGGYQHLAINKSGTEIADWLNSIGITGIVLKYRVPPVAGEKLWTAPLQDIQRAMGIVRSRAEEWGIDSERIGVIGFSAGAHLSAALSTNYEGRTYEAIDEIDNMNIRPDFAIIIYPGYLRGRTINELSPELEVTDQTPPTFILQTADDYANVENSVAYYMALKRAGAPVEMHLYPEGGHGYGIRPTGHDVSSWPDRCRDFLESQGILTAR